MSLLCADCGAPSEGREAVCPECRRPLALAPGSVLSGRYEVQARIGEGGMGVIYRARDRDLEDVVALKLLRPEFSTPDLAQRLKKEMKLARRVSHRNVCRMHEYGQHGVLVYVSMELVEGGDLRQLARPRGVDPETARELLVGICQGLQAIHEVGIVHRDLKTANVMRDAAGVVKVMDFGIARQIHGGGDESQAGIVVGTPEYMSPEQALGENIDFRSDIYSLGVVGYELLTGTVPLRGATPVATLLLVASERPVLDGVVPPGFVTILSRALAKDPHQRFATVRALAAALRAAEVTGYRPVVDLRTGPETEDDTAATAMTSSAADESAPLAALVSVPGTPAVDDAVLALEDPDDTVRWRAAVALWSLGALAAGALDALRRAARDPSEEVAEAASEAVRRIEESLPEAALPPAGAAAAVTEGDQLRRFVDSLRSEDPSIRWRSLLAIGALGPSAALAVEPIADALEDEDEQIGCAAAQALGRIGPAAAPSVPALAAATGSGNPPALRACAARALRDLGPAARAAVPALIDLLAATEEVCGEAASEALAAIGAAAVPALLEALGDRDRQVRWRAALLLTRIGFTPPSAVAPA